MKTYNQKGYIVWVSENALIPMCMNGLEAYVVPSETVNGNKKRVETVGLVWGHETTLTDGRTFYSVELVTIETSAIQRRDFVNIKNQSLQLKRDMMTSFWPRYDFLGEFHTHPEKDYEKVSRQKLYYFSQEDLEDMEKGNGKIHNYRVGIVMTIAKMKKRSSSLSFPDPSTVCFTLGDFKIWIKAYITYHKKDKLECSDHRDQEVKLDIPLQVGIVGEYTRFGKFSNSGKSKSY